MRKAILVIILAVVTSNAAAAWIEVDRDNVTTIYADPATIRKAGNKVKMWTMADYRTPRVANGEQHMSSKSLHEYDCKESRFRDTYVVRHSNNMGGGAMVSNNPIPSSWVPIPPGTVGEALMEIACGKR